MNGENARPRRIWLHVVLFIVTFATTTIAGAWQNGVDILSLDPREIASGLPFSCTLMTILLAHEMGHYLMSRRYRVEATLPFFIPGPSIIGTFGAVIKMQSRMPDRKSLFDIGAAGPIAGLILSVPAVIVGLKLSTVVPVSKEGVGLGDSLLFKFLGLLTWGNLPDGSDILLHPIAFAGWVGLFVTALNLLPAGQLDGGHVSYALFGRRHVRVSQLTVIGLLLFGIRGWFGWILWAFLILLLIGVRHPPPVDPDTPLDAKRKLLGWLMLATFVVTFIPDPFPVQEAEMHEELPPPEGREGLQRTNKREDRDERATKLAPVLSHDHARRGRALHL
ncbi:MAG TPA: site-2 protease family protein [Candidatus Binatia bacterium]|nr:site-2 protease family protein [Candidatus Binatia bacterium]